MDDVVAMVVVSGGFVSLNGVVVVAVVFVGVVVVVGEVLVSDGDDEK